MPTELVVPHFAQAQHFHAGRVKKIRLGVLHAGITPETDGAAEGMVDFAASPRASVASFHLAADRNSLARGVHDWDTAFGAPGANADGLHMEQAGNVQNRRGWTDPYSLQMIREQTARGVRSWHDLYGLPFTHLSLAQIADDKTAGFCLHHDVTRALPAAHGTHVDPGDEYPFDILFAAADQHPSVQPKTKVNPYNRHDQLTRWTQWALGIPVDGVSGPQTKAALTALRRRHGIALGLSYPDAASLHVLEEITR